MRHSYHISYKRYYSAGRSSGAGTTSAGVVADGSDTASERAGAGVLVLVAGVISVKVACPSAAGSDTTAGVATTGADSVIATAFSAKGAGAGSAAAVVAARRLIVEGAVGMVEMALAKLSEREIVHLDEERKAAMVSNLLVVLCGDKEVSPVVNTGTLHH